MFRPVHLCLEPNLSGITYGSYEPIRHAMDNRIDGLQVPILLNIQGNSNCWFSVSIQGHGSSQDEIGLHSIVADANRGVGSGTGEITLC